MPRKLLSRDNEQHWHAIRVEIGSHAYDSQSTSCDLSLMQISVMEHDQPAACASSWGSIVSTNSQRQVQAGRKLAENAEDSSGAICID